MKTKEELNALKNEFATLNAKLAQLTDEELAQVSGGEDRSLSPKKKKRPPLDPCGTVLVRPLTPEDID